MRLKNMERKTIYPELQTLTKVTKRGSCICKINSGLLVTKGYFDIKKKVTKGYISLFNFLCTITMAKKILATNIIASPCKKIKKIAVGE